MSKPFTTEQLKALERILNDTVGKLMQRDRDEALKFIALLFKQTVRIARAHVTLTMLLVQKGVITEEEYLSFTQQAAAADAVDKVFDPKWQEFEEALRILFERLEREEPGPRGPVGPD